MCFKLMLTYSEMWRQTPLASFALTQATWRRTRSAGETAYTRTPQAVAALQSVGDREFTRTAAAAAATSQSWVTYIRSAVSCRAMYGRHASSFARGVRPLACTPQLFCAVSCPWLQLVCRDKLLRTLRE